MAIGASVGGLLADRFGRRQVFAVTLLVYGLATGASALVGGLAALLVLRFLVGPRPRRRAARRLDLRQRVRPGAHARPADRDPRGLLGRGLDGRGAHRLLRHPGLRERLALGVRARRDPRRLRPRRAVGTAGVRALARAPRSPRRGRSRGARLRGSPRARRRPPAGIGDRSRSRRPRHPPRASASRRSGPRSSACAPRASGWCGSASTSRTTARSSGSRRSSSRRATTWCARSASPSSSRWPSCRGTRWRRGSSRCGGDG